MNWDKPMTPAQFSLHNGREYCDYHGIEHTRLLTWGDVYRQFEIDGMSKREEQYKQYLAFCKKMDTPLARALS